jgi:S1-C subfamily serine protease
VITALDDKPVRSANDVYDVLEHHQVGDTVRVTVLRDGQEQQVTATLTAIEGGGLA